MNYKKKDTLKKELAYLQAEFWENIEKLGLVELENKTISHLQTSYQSRIQPGGKNQTKVW